MLTDYLLYNNYSMLWAIHIVGNCSSEPLKDCILFLKKVFGKLKIFGKIVLMMHSVESALQCYGIYTGIELCHNSALTVQYLHGLLCSHFCDLDKNTSNILINCNREATTMGKLIKNLASKA